MGFRSWFSTACAVALLVAGAAAAPVASAAPADIDTSYGTNGLVERQGSINNSYFRGEYTSSTLDGGGNLLVVSTARTVPGNDNGLYVARYLPSGAPDPSFPTLPANGPIPATPGVRIDFGPGTDAVGTDVEVQADGKILVYGTLYDQVSNVELPVVARLNADGTLDTNFNGGLGFRTIGVALNFSQPPQHGLAVDGDGKILYTASVIGNQVVVGRLNSDGTQDGTFGPNGFRLFSPGPNAIANDVKVLPSGKVVVVGQTDNGAFIAQRNEDGTADGGFGTSPGLTILPGTRSANALAIDADGRIVVVGATGGGIVSDAFVARLNTDGTPQSSFGQSGIKLLDRVNGAAFAAGVALQPDGKIVTVGTDGVLAEPEAGAFISRLNADGSVDSGFGTNGYTIVQGNFNNTTGNDVVVDRSGRILGVGGQIGDSAPGQIIFALMGTTPPPPPDPQANPDLAIEKVVSNKKPKIGQQFTYTVTVRNTGSGPAAGVVMTDPVPRSIEVGRVTPSQGDCTVAKQKVTCELGGIPAGAGAEIKIKATPTKPGKFKNTARIPGDRAGATIRVPGKARLAITKTVVGDDTVRVGDEVRFRVEVESVGNIAAKKVVTCDDIPSGLEFTGGSSGFFIEDGQVCWKGGTLKPGKSVSYLVATEALRESGRIVNPAVADGSNTKPVDDTATVRVRPDRITGQDGVTG